MGTIGVGEERALRVKKRGLPIPRLAGFLLVLACITIIVVFAFAKLTDREIVLLGIFQTLLSLAAGWVITHAYAEDSLTSAITEVEDIYQRNLQTYALKAAEKVENLSMQLTGLAAYLNEELEETAYANVSEELAAKEERIYSAVHLVNVLKSVNDTSLSDWRGVIGAELDRRQEKAEEREEEFERILDQLSSLNTYAPIIDTDGDAREASVLRKEINAVKEDLRKVARNIGVPVSVARKQSRWPIETYSIECPCCASTRIVNHKSKPGSMKALTCRDCGSQLIFTVREDGSADLHLRRELVEEINCPECTSNVELKLDEWIGSTDAITCDSCQSLIRVSRSSSGLRVLSVDPPISEVDVAEVQQRLPQQPWPKGIHRKVADDLNLTPKQVQTAISRLIESGVFKDQYNGVLCTPEEKVQLMRLDRVR